MDTFKRGVLTTLNAITDPLGVTVVDLEVLRRKKGITITVVVDKPGGVTIDDCERVTKLFNAKAEVSDVLEGENYSFQVSSPGLYRVLKNREEYDIFRARKVRVFLNTSLPDRQGRLEYEGVLGGVREDGILLETGNATLHIPFEKINKTKLNG